MTWRAATSPTSGRSGTITAFLELIEEDAPERRVKVRIQHPLMPKPRDATYGCMFEVRVGERVVVPPAPLWPESYVGIVVALESDYIGPLKYLLGRAA